MKKQMTRILSAALFSLFVLFLGACDQNMANPDDLRQFSFSVTDFSVDPVEIIYGESASLTWDIKDPDGLIQYLEVIPEVGPQGKNLARTVKVFPKTTTTYFLNIYKDNVLTNKRGVVSVKVKTAEGKEIVDESDIPPEIPTTETSCADGIDEDQDGTADCADSDCAEDVVCYVPNKFTDCTTYPTASAQNVIENETVTVSWAGCPFYKVIHDGIPYEATGSVPVTATELGTLNIVLDGRSEEGLITDTVVIPVTVGPYDSPSFAASCSLNVYSASGDTVASLDCAPATGEENPASFTEATAKFIAGESYRLAWTTNLTATNGVSLQSTIIGVDEEGNPLSQPNADESHNDDLTLTAGDHVSHELTVTDNNGISVVRKMNMVTAGFVKMDEQIFGSKTAKKMIPGKNAGEYYFIVNGDDESVNNREEVFFHTQNNLETITAITTDIFTEITAFAADANKIYLGNLDGCFEAAIGTYNFEQKCWMGQLETLSTFFIRPDGHILAGSEFFAYDMRPTASGEYYRILGEVEGCEASMSCPTLTEDGSIPVQDEEADFYLFTGNPHDPDHIIALTDQGLFESTDGGVHFSKVDNISAEFTNGFWAADSGFLWSADSIFEWTGDQFQRVEGTDIEGHIINFVVRKGDLIFVATDEGIGVSRDGVTGHSDVMEEPTKFLIVSGSKIIAITANMDKYVLDLSVFE